MTAALEARVAELEAVVGAQAVKLARLESRRVALGDDPLCGLNPFKRWLFDRTLAEVAAAFRVPAEAIAGESREGGLIQPRFAAIWLFRELSRWSFHRIAPLFGYTDHGSVAHALNRADGWRATDPDFAAVTDRIAERIAAERAEWRP